MNKDYVKNIVLLSTGRNKNLVAWELRNQISYCLGETALVSITYLDNEIDISTENKTSAIALNIDDSVEQNGVFFKAKVQCIPAEIDILKAALANCILLRYVYEEEVVAAVGRFKLQTNFLFSIC